MRAPANHKELRQTRDGPEECVPFSGRPRVVSR